uniref:Uncharacterized protein n=1 Tax=Aegilops tauschii subsp. strangulata TaxID=200361 RepID=A0A453P3Q5_AEGTS
DSRRVSCPGSKGGYPQDMGFCSQTRSLQESCAKRILQCKCMTFTENGTCIYQLTYILFNIKVEVTALPSYEENEELFKEQVGKLRHKFIHSIDPGGLAADRRGVIPASGFCISAMHIWKVIRENKDLNLPAHKIMVATVRCEEIADEKLRCFMLDEGWLELEAAVTSGPVRSFGMKLSDIIDFYLLDYDMETMYFDE